MHGAGCVGVDERLPVAKAGLPAGVHEDRGAVWQGAVLPFPCFDVGHRDDRIGIALGPGADVDDGEGHHQRLDGQTVEAGSVRDEMAGRVDLGAEVLVDLPAVGGDAVLLDRGDRDAPEREGDARDGDEGEVLVQCVRQVDDVSRRRRLRRLGEGRRRRPERERTMADAVRIADSINRFMADNPWRGFDRQRSAGCVGYREEPGCP